MMYSASMVAAMTRKTNRRGRSSSTMSCDEEETRPTRVKRKGSKEPGSSEIDLWRYKVCLCRMKMGCYTIPHH